MKVYLAIGFLVLVFLSLESIYVSALEKDFEVSALVIKSVVNEGESVSNPIKITNYNRAQKFSVDYFSENNFISVEPDSFLIGEKGSKTFNVIFNTEDYRAGVYSGKIVVKGEKNSISVPVILEIETPIIEFDVSPEMTQSNSEVLPGSEFVVDVKVYNLKLENKEVSLHYAIKDMEGNILLSEFQDLEVLDEIKITKTFLLPADMEPQDYIFSISAIGKKSGFVGTSSALFGVSLSLSPSVRGSFGYYLDLILVGLFVLVVSFLIVSYYWNKRLVGNAIECNRKIIDTRKIKSVDIEKEIKKLEYKKSLLETAYKKGYIKEDSYREGKKNVSSLIDKLNERLIIAKRNVYK